MIKNSLMNKMFGGSPEQHPENYIRYSMYSGTEKDGISYALN
jgi:hypothetical protein